ncbi:uncharacterized protein NPIL_601221 [Nephila pilipes]|uniref:Uncharacterized protein n=1 Tax=Nephila pilipes TaxID=299642 RepID=A0A8X6MS23_NEPPI|nr:uncharacterized protein NPIL_601221 [Nephila pilipes]
MSSIWIGYRHQMEAIGAHKNNIVNNYSFRLNAATTLIYRVKQSRSQIFSINTLDESIDNNEPPANRRIPVFIPHDIAKKKDEDICPKRWEIEVTECQNVML